MNSSPFIHTTPVLPPIFSSRENELKYINNALFDLNESVVIYGNDAIGKSSIVGTVYSRLNTSSGTRSLPVRINAFDFVKAVDDNFLGITVHQICATIWTKLFGRSYSELIEEAMYVGKVLPNKSDEEHVIKRIFRIVTSEKITGTGSTEHELGLEYILKGKKGHKIEILNERKSLNPFEFEFLLDELVGITAEYGFSSILVCCDELNHLPSKTNTDILRNYFSLFSSKKIQFLIIVVNPELQGQEYASKLIESFNCSLEIKPFKTKEDVSELLDNSMKNLSFPMSFSRDCVEFLFAQTEGHPWWLQKICDHAFISAANANLQEISIQQIEKSHQIFANEIHIYRQRVANGLPFRKYNLISKL